MADTALFSSFHRPRTPVGEPIEDLPKEAAIRTREPDPAPTILPASSEADGPPLDLAGESEFKDGQAPFAPELDEAESGQDIPGSHWVDLTAIPLDCDQLGLQTPSSSRSSPSCPASNPSRSRRRHAASIVLRVFGRHHGAVSHTTKRATCSPAWRRVRAS